MAAKIDKEMLKKQHFWLLLIPLVVGLLLAWIGLFVGVADATDEQANANNNAKSEVERATAQSRAVLKLYDERKQDLFKLRTQRWKEMWDLQQGVYEWPKSLGEDQIAKVKDLKFGAQISDDSFLSAFRDYYAKEYEDVVKEAEPIQFAGGWYSVLRYVPKWTRNPTSEDVWLATEDFWVEREMIRALNQVNKDAGKCKVAEKDKADEKDGSGKERVIAAQSFANRTWKLNLKLVEKSNGVAIQGTVRNLTHRLQPFNVTNELVFNVWLSDDESAKPFRFAIEGASVEGDKTEKIKFVEKKHMVFDGTPRGLFRVEQVFDVRTAPVKRVDNLKLGYLSARHSDAELQMPAFSTKAVEDEANAAGGNAAGGMGVGGGVGGPPPGMGLAAGGPPPGPRMTSGSGIGGPGMAGMGGPGGQQQGDMTYNGLVRRRYISRTDQVRAMPIGLTVIADQSYVQDVLTAVTNCKLRFQTVQTHLARFRGNLAYAPSSSDNMMMMGGNMMGGPGEGGIAGPGGPPPGPGGPPPGPGGPPPGPGGPPPGPGFGMGPVGPGMPGVPGMPSGPLYPGFGSGSMPRTSSEDQVAANLVELSVYGITTLYEKFESPDKKADSATEPENTSGAAAPGSPMAPSPTPKDKAPAAPTPMPKDMPPVPTPKDKGPAPAVPEKK